MRVIALFATINAGALAFTPQASPRFATNLAAKQNEVKGNNNIVGGAVAFLAGLATFGHVAVADASILVDSTIPAGASNVIVEKQAYKSSSMMVAIGAPSFSGGKSFDTLDFSLPSYSEANGGDSSPETKSAPTFSASFPELKLPGGDEAKKDTAAEEAAAKKSAEEEKASKEQAKVDARIAKEKEAAEKEAKEEKKKADIAARRESEKKKQEEMVARQRASEEKAAAADAAAKAADESAAKKVESAPTPAPAPKPKPAPPVVVPEVSAPKLPEFTAPEIPSFSAPDIKIPSFSAPDIKIPSFSAPKFEMPAAPSASTPKLSYDLDVKAPSVPSFSSPAPESPKKSLEPQEVRDGKARSAKDKFKNLDNEAKALEQKADDARQVAKAAKKQAKDAKDDACQTRAGGKVLCIRSLGSGY